MKTILLIEDNEELRDNTADILAIAGYHVLTAENGMTGFEKLLEHKPDLVICDIMMPVLDGFGVLHLMQQHETLRDTPFIFLTAKTERADFRKGMGMGADDYLTKPFSGTELWETVANRLRKAAIRKKEFAPNLEGMSKLMYEATGKATLQSLAEGRNIDKYRKKQVIYTEGNHPTRLFFVQKGKVKTSKTNDQGKELVLDIYTAGDFLGYNALLEGSLYKETAIAMEDSEIALIPATDFQELLNNNHEVASQLIKMLAKNVSDKEQQLLGLAYNSLRKKVAEALLNLLKKYNPPKDTPLVINISRENLANIAGTATESLIRTLSDFRDEQMIEIKEGAVVILNEKKLANLLA
ncbi:response regulator [Chitinophaga oryzae]|uniref:Response regulator n=1 Tax=Chitinophaga oryzae TaxID=2725414 RepID=A0AAE6ZEK1_9BACT|nr:response regulator [Chitinophaga oryzae]QJB30427.1 response regulator [Chitinophaga oryzae]QJB36937.1 response regulator [Chitinophaga oryzae]